MTVVQLYVKLNGSNIKSDDSHTEMNHKRKNTLLNAGTIYPALDFRLVYVLSAR